ncbi:hypothetical protein [Mariniplasma anaerobium]|uniref:Uncharacterized protein n=1 Tax=Mariniplasma anaerobium TaxID=2735436 RepID=A0A7U9TJS2_9MOLU|nr:hypothetical protein [Mariniplasma anaerobium]BCR36543.1 hypothetical protein MPAN_014360 [Mariniplasma anaerobium]
MKERNLLYFITALVASILLLISILARTQAWFNINDYGQLAIPTIHYLLIPVALLWVGWYFEVDGLLLSAAVILSIVFGFQLNNWGLLNNDPYIVSRYAPMVKTVYVLGLVLNLGTFVLAFFTYVKSSLSLKQD